MEESRENFSELTSRPPVLNRTLSNFYDIALAKVHTLSWLKSRKKQGHGSAALDAVPEETKREIAAWWEALTKKKGAELRVRHVLEVWNEQSGRRLTREQRAALTKWCKGGSEEAMIDFPAFRGLCLDLMELGYASQSASFKLSHTSRDEAALMAIMPLNLVFGALRRSQAVSGILGGDYGAKGIEWQVACSEARPLETLVQTELRRSASISPSTRSKWKTVAKAALTAERKAKRTGPKRGAGAAEVLKSMRANSAPQPDLGRWRRQPTVLSILEGLSRSEIAGDEVVGSGGNGEEEEEDLRLLPQGARFDSETLKNYVDRDSLIESRIAAAAEAFASRAISFPTARGDLRSPLTSGGSGTPQSLLRRSSQTNRVSWEGRPLAPAANVSRQEKPHLLSMQFRRNRQLAEKAKAKPSHEVARRRGSATSPARHSLHRPLRRPRGSLPLPGDEPAHPRELPPSPSGAGGAAPLLLRNRGQIQGAMRSSGGASQERASSPTGRLAIRPTIEIPERSEALTPAAAGNPWDIARIDVVDPEEHRPVPEEPLASEREDDARSADGDTLHGPTESAETPEPKPLWWEWAKKHKPGLLKAGERRASEASPAQHREALLDSSLAGCLEGARRSSSAASLDCGEGAAHLQTAGPLRRSAKDGLTIVIPSPASKLPAARAGTAPNSGRQSPSASQPRTVTWAPTLLPGIPVKDLEQLVPPEMRQRPQAPRGHPSNEPGFTLQNRLEELRLRSARLITHNFFSGTRS